ncbi:dihydrofolate reductase [Alistipes sp. kh20]|uniref:dipeptidyl-peptidase 3 family protein n=1 Tax=Alistipes montrealensis TaxID=2834113 RepID=UPI001BCED9E2|nr:dihydrofolate reductase [Alistipes montrealensis]MBS4765090.1 dihydrofolate reductase [Alistipes montrealensis]
MTFIIPALTSCGGSKGEAPWIVDRFDDIKVIRYEVPGFEQLPLEEKELIYYLSEAAKCGRDILFDQNCPVNLPVRRTLEVVYENYQGDRTSAEWLALEKYLKKVWFANGIHHHYSNDKFVPEFTEGYLLDVIETIPEEKFGSLNPLRGDVCRAIFDPALYKTRLNQKAGDDLLLTSSSNYYHNVSQAEAEAFYAGVAAADAGNPEPVSYGLNSQLVKDDTGRIYERVWKLGGMYSPAIEKIVYWLEKAQAVAAEPQKTNIEALISYYKTGDLKEFDRYNIGWVKDTVSNVDFVNGFIEDYGDPLGRKASWEANVNFMDTEACHRTEIISDNAQWFEDHSPVAEAYRKPVVKGVSAKVITVAMLGGDCYPATPIGINLPNADWIRKEYGSKSVTIDNITYAYDMAAHGNGFNEEFVLRAEDRERMDKYGKLADDLHTDLHECLGHGSGQLAPGVKGGELKSYGSTLEEARADLFGLYYLGDPKLVELGLIPSLDVAKAGYAKYILNGMMTQLARIEPGKNVEESHMRNRKLICEWCYERGKADNVIEMVKENGKTYAVVNDFDKLRELFGEMLREVQRIKSEGDYEAGHKLVEQYAVTVDPQLHKEVRDRYYALNIEPYGGFVNPEYELVEKDGKIVDVKISYPANYVEQMLGYAKDYSFLPNIN